nr:YiaA/YiaB family inner membrane protein [Chitinophaga sp. GbtcB8]
MIIPGYLIGLWRAEMLLNEKGYYFTILMPGGLT